MASMFLMTLDNCMILVCNTPELLDQDTADCLSMHVNEMKFTLQMIAEKYPGVLPSQAALQCLENMNRDPRKPPTK